jgi:tRNA-2-methylthio-N6-dimethylallyladenosine synthase
MFEYTLNAIKELEIDFVYIARYSVRNGTIASKIYPDDIPDEVKADRWHRLNDVLEENVRKRGEKMIGNTFEVLVN